MAFSKHLRSLFVLSTVSAGVLAARGAGASNVLEVGEGGSEQMQRGGAWIARASTPNAAYYNPAGLAGQDTKLSLDVNIIVQHTCMSRVYAAGDTTLESGLLSSNPSDPSSALFPRVCNDIAPFANPQLSFAYRVNERVGLGISLLGPNAAGRAKWPEFVNGANPAPQRYLLLKSDGVQFNPTVAVGWEPIDNLRIGGSFQWGIASLHLQNASQALNADSTRPDQNDVRGLVQVKQFFIPGFTLGAIYSATPEIDLAAWYKWSAPINATGDVVTDANYFTKAVQGGDTAGVKGTDTSAADCGYNQPSNVCGSGKNASIKANIPMEAKLGFRYHKPRVTTPIADADPQADPNAPPAPISTATHRRDPMSQDVWDAEVNLTWANNSALDSFKIRFPGNANGDGVIPVNGIAGGTLPPNADVPKHFKDVFGIRVGGDYNLLPDQLALRGGVFAESNGQDQQYQSVDFAGAARFGFALGGTYRVKLGNSESKSALEFSLGYGHIFFAKQDQGANDRNAAGVAGIAGVACNPTGNNPASPAQPDTCTDGKQKYRTNWPVNLGTIWNSVNTVNVGVAYRF
jgi:long-subunit fatty acid transport protein